MAESPYKDWGPVVLNMKSRGVRLLGGGTAIAVVAALSIALPAGAASAKGIPAVAQAKHATNLPASSVHAGSVIVAFRGAVTTSGHHVSISANSARAAGFDATAASNEAKHVNSILDGLGATSVKHLFTNIPASKLNAARASAMKASGHYITDFTQVYQVTFNPKINDGEAANRLQSSGLVWTAMPDFKYQTTVQKNPQATNEHFTKQVMPKASAAAKKSNSTAASLPPNYGYTSDLQSYHDAASNDVTGALVELAKKYHQTPGQGEYVTNISLGTIDDTSTVVDNGQRYLEQTGMPKIPAYLSSETCTGPPNNQTCNINLDGDGTNTADGQGDLTEVMLDFSVMAPPPTGDPRVVHQQTPGQAGNILGAAYGANFRLINPQTNGTPDFVGAWLGAGFLQSPAPAVITASIGNGLPPGEFPDDQFEAETLIRDATTTLTLGANIFVTISAGDGQTDTDAAGPPNGTSGPTNIAPKNYNTPDLDSLDPTNPNYTYLWTNEQRLIQDSGTNVAGGTTLNDVFNNEPNNWDIPTSQSHSQETTETRWTGQQNFHSATGTRTFVAAPADDVIYLQQVEDDNGIPVDPISVEPELIGGTSASCPEVAAAAAIIRQLAKDTGHPLSAVQTRNVLQKTGHDNLTPTFDTTNAQVGQVLDVTAAANYVLAKAHVSGKPQIVRMTVADRKAVPYSNGYARGFYTDTPQDAVTNTATINLGQGLTADSSFDNETIGDTGDNINAPITFGVDTAFAPSWTKYSWYLQYGHKTVKVPAKDFDSSRGYLRLLPVEILSLVHQPFASSSDRVINVIASTGWSHITEHVTFAAAPDASYTHAQSPTFNPLVVDKSGATVTVHYDFLGLRNANGGELIVSDIDRALPRAFSDRDINSHGIVIPLTGMIGSYTLPVSMLQGAGTYGLAVRGTLDGVAQDGTGDTNDSSSSWIPLRVIPKNNATPQSPKVEAGVSAIGGTQPLWWDVQDTEASGGSQSFQVAYNVKAVPGAKGAIIEAAAPSQNFFGALFLGNADLPNANTFTNPLGDRLDNGNREGDPGESGHVTLWKTKGLVTLHLSQLGMVAPTEAGVCDNTYQIRVFATDGHGHIIGSSSYTSLLSVADMSSAACALPAG